MMSIFIARHLISIIAQIANDEGKGEGKKKNCIKSPVLQCFRKEGGSARMVRKKTWCIGNFLVGDTSSLDEARKQKFRRDESKKYFLFCKRLLDCNALLKLSWCIECMKRSQMVIAVKTLKVKKIGQISDDAFEDIIQSDFFMYLPFKIAKMGLGSAAIEDFIARLSDLLLLASAT